MQAINLDISRKHSTPPIYAKQCEVGRKFLAVITDNGVPYNIPNNALLSVWYEGDTDAGNYSSIGEQSAFAIEGNTVTVELVAQMLLKPGGGQLCLSITYGDGRETNTWNIPYSVEYKPGSGSSVPTEYYTALTNAGALAAEQVGMARDHAADAARSAGLAQEAVDGYVKLTDLEALLLAYEQKKTPVGYTFSWLPVEGSNVDLSTPDKVAAYFGFGVWEQIKDAFLLAAGDTYAAGTTGGEATHTLTKEEMPSHTHEQALTAYGYNGWDKKATSNYSVIFPASNTDLYKSAGFEAPMASVSANTKTHATGEGKPMDIMPPYVVGYVWKRIA